MKRFPPYGAKLAQGLAEGKSPKNSVYCFCGEEAWQRAAASAKCRPTLCLPYDTDPFDYHWPVCKHGILLYDTGGMQAQQLERLAYCLLKHGTPSVHLITSDNLFVYRR